MKPCTDEELKAMRDAVYPVTVPETRQTRESWESIKHNWRRDEAWLTDHDVKLDIEPDYRVAGWETPTIVAALKRIIRDVYDTDEEAGRG